MKTRKTYAAALLAAGILSILGCAPAMADTDGFSEEYYRFQNPDEILSGDEAEQLNEQLDEISHNGSTGGQPEWRECGSICG